MRSSYIYAVFLVVYSVKRMLFSSVLYLLRCADAFRKSGRLFQIVSSKKIFCSWLVFRKDWFNFSKDVLVIVLSWKAGLNGYIIHIRGVRVTEKHTRHWANPLFEAIISRQSLNFVKLSQVQNAAVLKYYKVFCNWKLSFL